MSSGRYKIKTVAERFDLSPTLLRAWERRYQLLEPQRLPSGHRLYTEEDLAVLSRIRELMQQGRSIGEIAAEGRQRLLGQSRVPEPVANAPVDHAPAPEFAELHRVSLAAAMRLDRTVFAERLNDACEKHGKAKVLLQWSGPFLREVGQLWAEGKLSVAAEHMVSAELRGCLQAAIAELPRSSSAARIMLAGLPDDQHELGLLLLRYVLLREGLEVLYLGPSLPLEDLERVVQDKHPEAVLLSVTREAVFLLHYHRLFEMVQRCPGVNFIVGGQGVAGRAAELDWRGVQHWPQERALGELLMVLGG